MTQGIVALDGIRQINVANNDDSMVRPADQYVINGVEYIFVPTACGLRRDVRCMLHNFCAVVGYTHEYRVVIEGAINGVRDDMFLQRDEYTTTSLERVLVLQVDPPILTVDVLAV